MCVDEPWHQSENCIVDAEKTHNPSPVSRDGLSVLRLLLSSSVSALVLTNLDY